MNAVGESRSEVISWPARGDLMGVGLGTHPVLIFNVIDISLHTPEPYASN